MKKTFFLTMCLLYLFTATSNTDGLFSFNKEELTAEMQDLQNLENYIVDNNGITFAELEENNSELLANVLSANSCPYSYQLLLSDVPLGIPSFVWGLCCGFAGVGIVYFMTEDREEVKKSLYGCLTFGGIYAVLYFVYAVAIVSTI
jgi:hypothetical protein